MGWLSNLFKRTEDGEAIRVEKVQVSRAVYTGPDIKERVEMRLVVEGGYKLTLDFNIDQAGQVIRQLTAAHDAIQPPLRPDLRGSGGGGF